jgi:hypothetical protein
LLPTLLFILGAYGLFAVHAVWSRRQNGWSASRSRTRHTRLTFTGSGVCLMCLFLLSLWLGAEPQEENHKLAGLLLTGKAHGWLADQASQHLEYLPIKSAGSGEQPTYLFLHPETAAAQVLPEKKPAPRQLRKSRLKKSPEARGKKGKAVSPSAKRDQAAGKNPAKKSKAQIPPRLGSPFQAQLRLRKWPPDLHHHHPQDLEVVW